MAFSIEVIQGISILRLAGKFANKSSLLEEFKTGVTSVSTSEHVNTVVNLSGVDGFDSSSIGELVGAYTLIQNAGGKLVLCAVPLKVAEILEMSSLSNVFKLFDTEQEAIDSFQ